MTDPGSPVRVFLDTAVIVQGALGRRSYVVDLLRYPNVSFVTSTYVAMREVRDVVARGARDAMTEFAANVLVDAFLHEFDVAVIDVYSPAAPADRNHAVVSSALGCDWICTYNLKDFLESRVPVGSPLPRTPRGLLREFDPFSHIAEVPRMGASGTLLVTARFSHDGVFLGEILSGASGTSVFTDDSGFVVVQSSDGSRMRARAPLPPRGYWFNFSFRYRDDGRFDASLWVDEEVSYVPPGCRASASGRVDLLSGLASFGPSAVAKIVLGSNYGFAGSLTCLSGVDRRLPDRSVKLAIMDRTFDFVHSSSAEDLVERIETVRIGSDGHAEAIAITLRSPNERVELPVRSA